MPTAESLSAKPDRVSRGPDQERVPQADGAWSTCLPLAAPTVLAGDDAGPRTTGLSEAAALARLPRVYRSWVPGVARVVGALILTAAGGLLLRSLPEAGDGSAVVVGPTATIRTQQAPGVQHAPGGGAILEPRALALPGTRELAAAGRTPGLVAAPQVDGGPTVAPQDLKVLMASPTGMRFVPPTVPVGLHADVSDGQGRGVAAADLFWELRSERTAAVVFRGRGADVQIPAGLLNEGVYHVTVRVVAGVAVAGDSGSLVLATGHTSNRPWSTRLWPDRSGLLGSPPA
jgi:hypothetical protein